MSKLRTAARNSLPSSTFGLPAQRKYPMPDASHAQNAKARAAQQVEKGNLTPSQKAEIDAKANKKLGKKKVSTQLAMRGAQSAKDISTFKP